MVGRGPGNLGTRERGNASKELLTIFARFDLHARANLDLYVLPIVDRSVAGKASQGCLRFFIRDLGDEISN
jgi:hypothetical protein